MDIQNYVAWFHDGTLKEIVHEPDKSHISILMSSSEILDWEEFDNKIELSKNQTIVGKLHLQDIKKITVNDNPYNGILQKFYADGEILDFEMEANIIELGILWHLSPKNDFSTIKIKAGKIWWENLPELTSSK